MLLIRIVAYNISLLWSFCLWATFRVYKHSAPPELTRLVAANGRAVPRRSSGALDRLERTTYRNRLPAGGSRLRARGQDVAHFNGTACFADFAVVAEEGAIPVPADVPFEVLATLGCAVVTGIGAVTNAARVERAARVAVIGAGGGL
jgi:NADPH:quinone reductase-like Zn-dependent oxidoreductase